MKFFWFRNTYGIGYKPKNKCACSSHDENRKTVDLRLCTFEMFEKVRNCGWFLPFGSFVCKYCRDKVNETKKHNAPEENEMNIDNEETELSDGTEEHETEEHETSDGEYVPAYIGGETNEAMRKLKQIYSILNIDENLYQMKNEVKDTGQSRIYKIQKMFCVCYFFSIHDENCINFFFQLFYM